MRDAAGRVLGWLLSRRERARRRKRRQWERQGRPAPPPSAVKHVIVIEHARRHRLETFVETGTFRGDTTAALRGVVRRIYTIELDDRLHARARARFAGDRAITPLHGDSARVLPEVLAELKAPALFWLDAHYSSGVTARGSEDTPVLAELDLILGHPVRGHVILIDDAREFGRDPAYPTLAALERHVRRHDPALTFAVEDDVIRIVPAQPAPRPLAP
jgi:hypothetical protein